jgi:hypothetical protein
MEREPYMFARSAISPCVRNVRAALYVVFVGARYKHVTNPAAPI